jgi:hypothetical protein
MARLASRSSRALSSVIPIVALTWLGGCVEPFGGSAVQLDFAPDTPAAGRAWDDPLRPPHQPPQDTYLTFYALDHDYQLDGDGRIVVDEFGRPVVLESRFFEVQRFELRPMIDTRSPCFIELEESRFPGLHITQYARKVEQVTGISNPYDAPGADPGDLSDVLTARWRVDEMLPKIEGLVKAVASYSTFRYPSGIVPPPEEIDDLTNRERLRVCRELWAANPTYYEGSDKVYSLPLNGTFHGVVEGVNPVNEGFLGGATIYVDEALSSADAFTINWQFKDYDGDGAPDYPPGFLDAGNEPSPFGYPFMFGTPERRARGVIHASLVNPFLSAANVEVAIFSDLGRDNVRF